MPNKLVREMTALAATAELALPLTEELAADIFMGAFARKFLDAAKVAARHLRGTRYARYYALPCEELLALDDTSDRWGAKVSPGFFALCEARAAAETAPDGERAEGPVPVVAGAQRHHPGAEPDSHHAQPRGAVRGLRARRGARGARGRAGVAVLRLGVSAAPDAPAQDRHAQLIALKASAYAWRQMLFFLSVGDGAARATFDRESEAHFAEQPEAFRARFGPAMEGLRLVRAGEELRRPGARSGGGHGAAFPRVEPRGPLAAVGPVAVDAG